MSGTFKKTESQTDNEFPTEDLLHEIELARHAISAFKTMQAPFLTRLLEDAQNSALDLLKLTRISVENDTFENPVAITDNGNTVQTIKIPLITSGRRITVQRHSKQGEPAGYYIFLERFADRSHDITIPIMLITLGRNYPEYDANNAEAETNYGLADPNRLECGQNTIVWFPTRGYPDRLLAFAQYGPAA